MRIGSSGAVRPKGFEFVHTSHPSNLDEASFFSPKFFRSGRECLTQVNNNNNNNFLFYPLNQIYGYFSILIIIVFKFITYFINNINYNKNNNIYSIYNINNNIFDINTFHYNKNNYIYNKNNYI